MQLTETEVFKDRILKVFKGLGINEHKDLNLGRSGALPCFAGASSEPQQD